MINLIIEDATLISRLADLYEEPALAALTRGALMASSSAASALNATARMRFPQRDLNMKAKNSTATAIAAAITRDGLQNWRGPCMI